MGGAQLRGRPANLPGCRLDPDSTIDQKCLESIDRRCAAAGRSDQRFRVGTYGKYERIVLVLRDSGDGACVVMVARIPKCDDDTRVDDDQSHDRRCLTSISPLIAKLFEVAGSVVIRSATRMARDDVRYPFESESAYTIRADDQFIARVESSEPKCDYRNRGLILTTNSRTAANSLYFRHQK
jgi:hypothetical protein